MNMRKIDNVVECSLLAQHEFSQINIYTGILKVSENVDAMYPYRKGVLASAQWLGKSAAIGKFPCSSCRVKNAYSFSQRKNVYLSILSPKVYSIIRHTKPPR
jgi:hypothetical protein